MSQQKFPLGLHGSDWPGVVGSQDKKMKVVPMAEMVTAMAAARHGSNRINGVDLICAARTSDAPIFLGPDMKQAQFDAAVNHIGGYGLKVGTLVSPSWDEGCRPFGTRAQCQRFVDNVTETARIGDRLDRAGIRRGNLVRIDSGTECNHPSWTDNPEQAFETLIATLKRAASAASASGQQLVFEPEAPWPAMNTLAAVERVLREVPNIGLQLDMAHFLHLLSGTAGPEGRELPLDWSWTRPSDLQLAQAWDLELEGAWTRCAARVGKRVKDLHVAQSNGSIHGGGDHPPTGRHCHPLDRTGVVDVSKVAKLFLTDGGVPHGRLLNMTWDGCLIGEPEDRYALLTSGEFWNAVLVKMVEARDAAGYAPIAA